MNCAGAWLGEAAWWFPFGLLVVVVVLVVDVVVMVIVAL